jgi:hypothetical protein
MGAEEQAEHDRILIARQRAESALISTMTNNAFEVSHCIELMESYPGHYYSFPEAARLHPLIWSYYVRSSIAEPDGVFSECPDQDILAFMDKENIGFTGGQLSLLYLHGTRFYSNNQALFMRVIMQDMRKKKIGILTFRDIGRYYLSTMKGFLFPDNHPRSGSGRREYRAMFDEFNAHFHYIFKHHPLNRFAACAQGSYDWRLFANFYERDELLKFTGGRRYLLEEEMGI